MLTTQRVGKFKFSLGTNFFCYELVPNLVAESLIQQPDIERASLHTRLQQRFLSLLGFFIDQLSVDIHNKKKCFAKENLNFPTF